MKEKKHPTIPVVPRLQFKGKRPGPIWKTVTEKKPFCPQCGGVISRATGDAATMFDWQCHNLGCYYVC